MKYIPLEKVVEIYNRIDGFVPKNKDVRASQASKLSVLKEVLNCQTELDEYDVYREVQHGFYLEDARNFIADELANQRDCDPEDITDEELDRFNYEGLVKEYERREDCNVAFNDTWGDIAHEEVSDYLDSLEWNEIFE